MYQTRKTVKLKSSHYLKLKCKLSVEIGISMKFDYLRGDNACDGNYMLRDLICVCWLEVTIELDQRGYCFVFLTIIISW